MKTSYFAKLRSIDKDLKPIAICLYPPKWYNGDVYKKLAPTWDILNKWKTSNKDEIAEQEYTEQYYIQVLNKLDAKKVYEELGEKSVLLCFEKTGDFCHRKIVAEWLNKKLGITVDEFKG